MSPFSDQAIFDRFYSFLENIVLRSLATDGIIVFVPKGFTKNAIAAIEHEIADNELCQQLGVKIEHIAYGTIRFKDSDNCIHVLPLDYERSRGYGADLVYCPMPILTNRSMQKHINMLTELYTSLRIASLIHY